MEAMPLAVLAAAEAAVGVAGHENDGPLCLARGFVPASPPRQSLPAAFGPWDDVAAALPQLYAGLGLRRRLEELPPLDADTLPDAALQRAATVLGILVHAYHRVEPRRTGPTPAALDRPWRRVCARLGRPAPLLTYLDLVVANWRPIGAGPVEVRVPRVRLLVPTVGTPEEQNFYLTQLEMLDRGTPLVGAAARAAAAAGDADASTLAGELAGMADVVADLTRRGLVRIDPRAGTRFHVDPVVWAKTVAPLAVPLVPGDLGPSGTASPIFMVLDAVAGRGAHRSAIGAEGRRLLAVHPRHWRDFVTAVERAGVPARAQAAGHPPLTAALESLRTAYAGRGGLLWRHRMKAVGYLDTAFRVGRDVTIADFTAHARVSRALAEARAERDGAAADGLPLGTEPPARSVPASELLRHHRGASSCWVALRGVVVDVTGFLHHHPGGVAPLAALTGTDATAGFADVGHGDDPAVAAHVTRLAIGRVAPPPFPPGSVDAVRYDAWLLAAVTATRWANVFESDLTVRDARTSTAAAAGEVTAYTVQFAIEAHERFTGRVLPELRRCAGALGVDVPDPDAPATGELWARLEGAAAPAAPAELAGLDRAVRAAHDADRLVLHTLRDRLVGGLAAIERAAQAATAPSVGTSSLDALIRKKAHSAPANISPAPHRNAT
jgi:cytochrome b involved in lipid metabolism